jgi:hypothetical protein
MTLEQLQNECGGVLPADAVLIPEGDPTKPTPEKRAGRRRGRSERFALLNAFTDMSLADLTGAEVKVWLILFRDTKAATGTARTGQTDLGRRAGIGLRTVRRALVKLESKGMLRIVRLGRLNVGPTTYRVIAGA